jgi:hypothetical protein
MPSTEASKLNITANGTVSVTYNGTLRSVPTTIVAVEKQ